MIEIDDDDIIRDFGLSRELTEHSQIENGRIMLDDKYEWHLHIYPATERKDIMYFILYNIGRSFNGHIYPMESSTKCARISITDAKYIQCLDCSKEEWILTTDEKLHLCEMLKRNDYELWKFILYAYESEMKYYDGTCLNILDLPMPDYTKM